LLYIAEIAITARHAAEGYLSDSDLSDSCSEYNPSESDRSISSEDESVGHEDEAVQEPKYQSRRSQRLQEMEYVSTRINYADYEELRRNLRVQGGCLYRFLYPEQLHVKCMIKCILEI